MHILSSVTQHNESKPYKSRNYSVLGELAQGVASKTKSKSKVNNTAAKLASTLRYENSASPQDTFACLLFINLLWMDKYEICFCLPKVLLL